jgi:nicotinamidase-related amidase
MYGVLVMEMQRDLIAEDGSLYMGEMARAIIPTIQKLLNIARGKGVPVVYANLHEIKDDPLTKMFPPHCVPGTTGAEVVDELKPKDEDNVVEIYAPDAFLFSSLERVLRILNIDTVIVVGVSTYTGCLLTAMGALLRGFGVIVTSDCCADMRMESHQAGLNYLKRFVKVLNSDEVIDLLTK